MKNAFRIVLASVLITGFAIKAGPALAEPARVAVSIVHTKDLNLSTDAGKRQLDLRLSRAARDVCGDASDADLAGKNEVRRCRDDVLADARAQQGQMLAAASRGEVIAVTASR